MKRLKTMLRNFASDRALMIRTTILVYALINQFLVALDYSPLPFAEDEIEQFISMLLTLASTIWVGYYNTNLTDEAVESQRYLDELKVKRKMKEKEKIQEEFEEIE